MNLDTGKVCSPPNLIVNKLQKMRNYFQEFIGTFFLIFIGVGSIILNDNTGKMSNLFIGMIFGLTVMIIVCLFGHKSGGYINPAVTIAFGLMVVLMEKKYCHMLFHRF